MANIVNVFVQQQVASAPSVLQQTGAFVTQGGTTLAANSTKLLTQASDLTASLTASLTIATATWLTSVVTITTTTPHGIPSGTVTKGVISGMTPAGYNGTYTITSTGTTTFTYPLVTNPGTATVMGAFILLAVSELVAQATTFFAQNGNQAVYVLELGVGSTSAGVTALSAYILSPTIRFYNYLLPLEWDVEPTAPTMCRLYTSTTAQQYFTVSTTVSTYTNWAGIKSVITCVQSPLAPATEFSAAAIFFDAISNAPSSVNLMSQMSYSFVYGVTAYLTLTSAQVIALTAAGVNWIGTGAQGQIGNTLIVNGTYMDMNPFNYWYATDWTAINLAIALAAAVINGSNTPTNPLYYNQSGINSLQKTAQAKVNSGISFGLVMSPATVTAVSFAAYIAANPTAYAAGTYTGLALTFVPVRGFTAVTIYLTTSNIPV